MNAFPIFDTYEDEMEYYAKQEQKKLPSKPSQRKRNPPPTKRSPETIEHSIEPALLGGGRWKNIVGNSRLPSRGCLRTSCRRGGQWENNADLQRCRSHRIGLPVYG